MSEIVKNYCVIRVTKMDGSVGYIVNSKDVSSDPKQVLSARQAASIISTIANIREKHVYQKIEMIPVDINIHKNPTRTLVIVDSIDDIDFNKLDIDSIKMSYSRSTVKSSARKAGYIIDDDLAVKISDVLRELKNER